MDGLIKQIDGWLDGQKKQMDGLMDRKKIDGWLEGRITNMKIKQMDDWMEKQIYEKIDGWLHEYLKKTYEKIDVQKKNKKQMDC